MIKKKILLTSTGFENEVIKKLFLELLDVEAKDANVLFVTTAANDPGAVRILSKCLNDLTACNIPDGNITVYDMHKGMSVEELSHYDAIYVCGGSTDYLAARIEEVEMVPVIDKYVDNGGIYIGVSAGSICASGSRYKNGLNFINNKLSVHCDNGTPDGPVNDEGEIFLTDNQAIYINGEENVIFE